MVMGCRQPLSPHAVMVGGDTSMEAAIADLEVCHASLKHQMTKIQLVKEQLREKWKQSNEDADSPKNSVHPIRWSSPGGSGTFSASQSQSAVVSPAPRNLLPLNLPREISRGSSENGSSESDAHSPLRRFPSGIHGWDSEDQAIYVFRPDGTIVMWNSGSEKLFGYTEEEAVGQKIGELLCCQQSNEAASQIIALLQCWAGNSPLTKKSGEVFDAMITDRPVIDNKGNVSMIVGVASDSRPFKEQVRAFIGSCSSSMHVRTSVGPVSAASPAAAAALHSATTAGATAAAAAAAAAASVRPAASFGAAASTPDSIPSPSMPLQSIPSPTAAEDKAERQQAAAGLKPLRWNAGSEKLFGYTEEEAMGRNIVELLCCKKTSNAAFQIIARLQVGHCWTGNLPLTKKSGEVFDAMITDRPIIDNKGNVILIVGVASDSRPFKEQIQAFIGSCSSSMHVSTSLGPVSTASPGAAAAAAAFHSVASALPSAAAVAVAAPLGAAASFDGAASTPDDFPSPATPLESIPSPTAAEDKAGDKAEHWQLAAGLKPLQLNVTTAPLRPIRVPENATIFATGNATGGAPSRVARVTSRLSAAPLRSPSHSRTTPLRLPELAYTDEADMTVPLAGLVARGSGALGFQGGGVEEGEAAAMTFDFPKGETAVPFDFSAEGGPGGGEAALPFEFDAEGEAAHAECQHPWQIPFASTVLSLAGRVAQSIGQVRKRLSPTSSTVASQAHLHLPEPISPQQHLPLPPSPPAAASANHISSSEARLRGGVQGMVIQGGRSPKASRLSPEGDRLSRHNSGSGSSCSSSSTAGAAAAGAAAAGAAAGGAAGAAAAGAAAGGAAAAGAGAYHLPSVVAAAHVTQLAPLQPETSLAGSAASGAAAAATASAAAADSLWHGFGFYSGGAGDAVAGDGAAGCGVGVGAIVPSGARASAALAAAAAATACHAHMEDLILADTPKDQGGMGGMGNMGGAGGMGIVGDMGDNGMGFVNGTDRWGGNARFLERQQGGVSMRGQEQRGALVDSPLKRLLERQQGYVSMGDGQEQREALALWQRHAQGESDGQGGGVAGRELRVEREQGNRERQERERFWEDGVARWEIRWEDIQLGQEVGHGACGTVYHGTWNGSDVAVKVFARHDISADFMHDFKKEIRIMEKLRHPNILLFMGAVASLDHLAIVTEFLPRGSLFRLLHRRTAGLTRLRLLRMALDVVSCACASSVEHVCMSLQAAVSSSPVAVSSVCCTAGLTRLRLLRMALDVVSCIA
ncbi:unnamed protein product [Closterium sp. Naga37s-1]|nr:unnamed protein product [Closterium sp. Naga37s-1]